MVWDFLTVRGDVMTKRKPLTKTQKLRKIVQQQVRRMENRGYRIAEEIKEKIKTGKYQTLLSLQRNKYAKVYEGATAEIDSNIVTGKEYRKYERKETARKAATTRQKRKRNVVWKNADEELAKKRNFNKDDYNQIDEQYREEERKKRWEEYKQRRRREEGKKEESEQEQWERERRKKDEEDMKFAENIDVGDIIYKEITRLIDFYPKEGSLILKKAFESEIRRFGKDAVVSSLAEAGMGIIDKVRDIIFYEENSDAIHGAIVDLFNMITGTILSAQDAKDLGDAMDKMTDMSPI